MTLQKGPSVIKLAKAKGMETVFLSQRVSEEKARRQETRWHDGGRHKE